QAPAWAQRSTGWTVVLEVGWCKCYIVSMDMFFFSSRRRHTRSKRDWSSDVCSSDLFLLVISMHLVTSKLKGIPSRHLGQSKIHNNKHFYSLFLNYFSCRYHPFNNDNSIWFHIP